MYREIVIETTPKELRKIADLLEKAYNNLITGQELPREMIDYCETSNTRVVVTIGQNKM